MKHGTDDKLQPNTGGRISSKTGVDKVATLVSAGELRVPQSVLDRIGSETAAALNRGVSPVVPVPPPGCGLIGS